MHKQLFEEVTLVFWKFQEKVNGIKMPASAYNKTQPNTERLSYMVKILFSHESFLLPVPAFHRGHMEEIQSQASEKSHPVSFCSAKTPTEGHPRGPSLLLFLTVQSLPMFFLGSELCLGELWDNSSGPIDLWGGELILNLQDSTG